LGDVIIAEPGAQIGFVGPRVIEQTTGTPLAPDSHDAETVLRAGMIAVNPQGAWHRFHSSEGVTLMTATPSPSEVIELDVDDPRTVERKPA